MEKIHKSTLLGWPWIGRKILLFTLHNCGFLEFVLLAGIFKKELAVIIIINWWETCQISQ